jgi:hypothetical protein
VTHLELLSLTKSGKKGREFGQHESQRELALLTTSSCSLVDDSNQFEQEIGSGDLLLRMFKMSS